MKLLLVHTNRLRAPQPVAPLGLCLVASAVAASGHEVRVLDLCFARRPETELATALGDWPPDAIGFSIRNLDNGESFRPCSYLPEVAAFVQVCRGHSSAPIILGGSAVNVAPAELLGRLGGDYAVVGEGEEALPNLLSELAAGRHVPRVFPPDSAARVADLATLPDPQPGRWLNLSRYFRNGAVLPIQSKRGCAFRCTYCTYPLLEGTEYRTRTPESVGEEIGRARREWGVRQFEFVDATFNHPYPQTLALCEHLAGKSHGASLHTMGLNPALATPELLRAMRAVGFRSAVCGVESGSDRMLESLQKGYTVEQVAQAAAAARESGLSVLWSFLIGGPGQDERTLRETLRLMETAFGPRDRFMITLGLRIYPRTQLAETARAEGVITPDTDLSDPVFYFSPGLTVERALKTIEASPARSRMVYLETLQRPSVALAHRLWTACRLPGATWSALPLYNRVVRALRLGPPR